MERKRLIDWLRLIRISGLGPVTIARLVARFGDPGQALAARGEAWRQVPRLGGEALHRLGETPPVAVAEKELDRLEALGIRALVRDDPGYPPQLRALADPPPLLFVQGDAALLAHPGLVAVVGSRAATVTGQRQARQLARAMVQHQLVVVSGLAVGIDTAAHQGALEAGGNTVAVLATGLDVPYPPTNVALKQHIARQGCLVTEASLGTPPMPQLFPNRNRIISGLSRAVVVVEAARDSGSLITARCALEQNREVFAMPGPAGAAHSQGSNNLLREGAHLLEGVDDLLSLLSWTAPAVRDAPSLLARMAAGDPEAAAVTRPLLTLLAAGPVLADELARSSQLTVGELSRILLQLELAGLVERLPGNQYVLRGA